MEGKTKGWLYKCEKYLKANTLQKVQVASMHMQGRPETWVQGVVREGMGLVCARGKTKQPVVGSFQKLKQWTDMES